MLRLCNSPKFKVGLNLKVNHAKIIGITNGNNIRGVKPE